MFDDSFSVLFIHHVARGIRCKLSVLASSRSGSLRQDGLLGTIILVIFIRIKVQHKSNSSNRIIIIVKIGLSINNEQHS